LIKTGTTPLHHNYPCATKTPYKPRSYCFIRL
jgi:hypothetical protein